MTDVLRLINGSETTKLEDVYHGDVATNTIMWLTLCFCVCV